jgi:type VII secretion protein EssB
MQKIQQVNLRESDIQENMEIRVQRADMEAKTIYDFKRLEHGTVAMLPMTIEEEKETLLLCFDMEGMHSITEVQKMEKLQKLELILQVAELEKDYMRFEFQLSPENLYYDRLNRVKIKFRDITTGLYEEQFLKLYQALIGYIMDGSRPYEDYLSGGKELLKDQKEVVTLLSAETLEEEISLLQTLYENYKKEETILKIKVDKKKYKKMNIYGIVSSVLLVVLFGAVVYGYFWHIPRQDKIVEANDAYLQKDYIRVIDSLKDFEIGQMERAQKYILATAYIQGESVDSFSTKDKEVILSKINYQSNEGIFDYWIHLGRMEVKEAENLALQMSDDQLLLYAYLQELSRIEEDQEMSGEEKSSKKQDLMKKVEELADKLHISYREADEEMNTETKADENQE